MADWHLVGSWDTKGPVRIGRRGCPRFAGSDVFRLAINMGREFRVGDEPVPGYRLMALLGEGAFGKVWRATGPGGTEVALKVTNLLDSKRGMREFRSLRLVKRLRHSNLVPIVGIWLIDADGVPLDDNSIDQLGSAISDSKGGPASGSTVRTLQFNAARAERLLVAMGLGEIDLFALLREYRGRGEPGIPVDKALEYMEEAAKAIDYLNEPRHDMGDGQLKSIYHCDIKPSNIMLVGGSAQVCDLGLAKVSDMRATTAALTCAYGAPELYWSKNRQPVNGTDQYSLAITYYELRTGVLPFSSEMSQVDVLMAHRDGNLDFAGISSAEQAVIRRATNPDPAARYESCLAMVRALRAAATGATDLLKYRLDAERQSGLSESRSTLIGGRELVPGYLLGEHLFHADVRTVVWSATDRNGKTCSLWIYDLANLSSPIDLNALRLIQSEAEHPNLARVFGWWLLNESGDDISSAFVSKSHTSPEAARLVIASESSRMNLLHRAQDRREATGLGLPVEELLDYTRQVSSALDALNAAVYGPQCVSLVHTDVRPTNLVVLDKNVKLSNLAWCRVLDQGASDTALWEHRPLRSTSAPEITEGRLDRRSDQYSLAATYMQLRSGNTVLESANPSAQTQAFSPSDVGLSDLEPEERVVIQRAMHAAPAERFSACGTLVEELSRAIAMPAIRVPANGHATNATSTSSVWTAPSSSGEDDYYNRGTLMPSAPAAEVPLNKPPKGRETVWNKGATTDPELPMPRSRWPARLAVMSMSLALVAGGAALVVSGRWQNVWVAIVGRTPVTDPSEPPEPVPVISPVPTPGETPSTPDELFQQDMNKAERLLAAGDNDQAAGPLGDAEKRLGNLHDPEAARQRLALFRAWLDVKGKRFDEAQQRIDGIIPEALRPGIDPLRLDVLRALTLARFDGPLSDEADLAGIAKAVGQIRARVAGWNESARRKDDLWLQARSLAGAVIDLAVKQAASESMEKQDAARNVLKAFPETEIMSLDDTLAVPVRVANATLVLAANSPWKEVRGALDSCDERAAKLVDADRQLLGSRLLSWANRTDEAGALGKALDAYDGLDLPSNSLHADLLIKWIEQLAWAETIDWRGLAAACDEAGTAAAKHKRHYLVPLCHAEYALELEKNAAKALQKLPAAPPVGASAEDQAYFGYVALRVEQAAHPGRPDISRFDRFCELSAGSPPCLAASSRKSAAAQLLTSATAALAAKNGFGVWSFLAGDSGSAGGDSHENAGRAFRWLDRARSLDPKAAQGNVAVYLAAASLEKADPAAPPSLPDEADLPPDFSRSVLFAKARSAALRGKHAEAIGQFARLWAAIDESPEGTNWPEVYQQVVKPALDLSIGLKQTDQSAETRASVAAIYAAKGKMLRQDASVENLVSVETGVSGPDAVYDAYDKAIASDPSVAGYYIRRGHAHWKPDCSRGCNLKSLMDEDIAPARDRLGGQEPPEFLGLLGVARVLEARGAEPGASDRKIKLFQEAIAYERKAADECDRDGSDYADFQMLRSMACLELANATTEPNDVIRGYLDQAVEAAEAAIADGRGAHPEQYPLALGNALEDYGLLLHDYDGYRNSLVAFRAAQDAAITRTGSTDEALIGLGRALFRLATSGSEPSQRESRLNEALSTLRAVTSANKQLAPSRLAETYYWQSRVHDARFRAARQRMAQASTTKQKTGLARETANIEAVRQEAENALKHALLLTDQKHSDWTTYQFSWAVYAPDLAETRRRAQPLLALPATAANAAARANAIALVASTYLTQSDVINPKTAELRKREREAGLKIFKEHLDWLPDVAKAERDDIDALVNVSEFILADPDFWRKEADLCRKSAERALALADESGALLAAARSHALLGKHSFGLAKSSTPVNADRMRDAADHLRAAVKLDDDRITARLTAAERHSLHEAFAPTWRYDLVTILYQIGQQRAAQGKPLYKEAIDVIDRAGTDVPEPYRQELIKRRTTLQQLLK